MEANIQMRNKKLASLVLAAFLICIIAPLCVNNPAAKAQTTDGNTYLLSVTSNTADCSVTASPSQDTYSYGDIVQLTPVAASGWNFSQWSGDNTGSDNPLTITMEANMSITALFITNIYNLTMNTIGQGSVTPGNSSYLHDINITLTATNDNGWTFQNWSDNNNHSSTNSILTITMSDNQNITATFVQNPQLTPIPTSTPTPTPTPTPSATSQPTPNPSSSPDATSTPPKATNSPKLPPPANTAGINEYVLGVAAGIILAGTAIGLILQKKKNAAA